MLYAKPIEHMLLAKKLQPTSGLTQRVPVLGSKAGQSITPHSWSTSNIAVKPSDFNRVPLPAVLTWKTKGCGVTEPDSPAKLAIHRSVPSHAIAPLVFGSVIERVRTNFPVGVTRNRSGLAVDGCEYQRFFPLKVTPMGQYTGLSANALTSKWPREVPCAKTGAVDSRDITSISIANISACRILRGDFT